MPSALSLKQLQQTEENNLYTTREIRRRNFILPYDGKYDYILKLFHRWLQKFSDDDLYFLMFCIISAGYFNNTDIYEHVILYENLSEDPDMELTRIFKVMGIPMKHLPAALGH